MKIKTSLLSVILVTACTTTIIAINSGTSDDIDGLPQYVVHPRTIESPNSLFSISIEPSNLNGRGSGEYYCTSKGNVLWSKTLPFTLWSGELTDQGTLVGYAYTQGVEGHHRDNGDVVVVAINAEGKILVSESIARTGSRFFHAPPTPTVNTIEIDSANDRFFVRWDDPDINRRVEKWDFYSLSSGKKQISIEPKLLINDQETSASLLQTHFIPGTTFTLALFKTYRQRNYELVYAIYGDTEEPLWLLQRDGEFEAATEELVDALHDRVNADGTILENKNPKQFDLQFIKEAQRVSFEIEIQSDRSVKVKETHRQTQKYVGPSSTSQTVLGATSNVDSSGHKELVHVGAIRLKPAKEQKPHPVRDISHGFDFDDTGNIGFVRAPKDTPATFVLVTQDGLVLTETDLAKDLLPDSQWNGAIYVGEKRFVVTASQSGVAAQSQAWVVDTTTKLITRLENFNSPPIEAIASFHDGGFVVLANERFKYTMSDSLTSYDSQGNRLWTVRQSYEEYPKTLFSPQGIAATTDGTLCVLEGTKKELQYFDKNGKSLRVVDLEEAWGNEPNYVADISAANDGGLMIYDFGGTPAYVEMNGTNIVRHGMDARIGKDRPVLHSSGPPRVSPSGKLWLSNGTSLFRVGRDGLVDHSIGAVVDREALGEIDCNMIANSGEIFAISRQTGAIHRFDPNGKWIQTIDDPALMDREYAGHPLFVLPEGDVYVLLPTVSKSVSSQRMAHFAASGEKVRTIDLTGFNAYCLGNDSFLCTSLTFALLRTNNGKLLKKIRRQPDGNWLQNIDGVAVAPDGSFAICTNHYGSNIALPASINIYSSKGDPIRTIVIPIDRHNNFDFDGQKLAISSSERTLVYSTDGTLLAWATHQDFSGKSLFIQPKLLKDGSELVLIDRNNPLEIRRYR